MSAHYLMVEPWDPDGERSDLIEVEHPADCPTIVRYAGDGTHPDVVEPNCVVAYHIDGCGLGYWFAHADDPDANPDATRLPPGRHEIEAWHHVSPAGPWGPAEHDGGLQLAE